MQHWAQKEEVEMLDQDEYSVEMKSREEDMDSNGYLEEENDNNNDDENKEGDSYKRIVRGSVAHAGPLNFAVSQLANVSLERATELMELGAVWAQWYDDEPFERVLSSCTIEEGTALRIYPNPRRFPSCCQLDDTSRLLYEDTTFIVVDKPPMLPTQPDSSNYVECCPGCVNDFLGPFKTIDGEPVERPLLCHRVDSCVGGCVVLSKDGNGQRVFSALQRDRKIKKLYLAVTTKPVPLGMHIHWMWAPLQARGQTNGPPCQFVSHQPPASRRKAKSWIRCVLEVSESQPIQIVDKDLIDSYPPDTTFYQSTIRLVTGRKHQVRAQLASLNCPIVRDTLYEPIAGLTLGSDMEEETMDEALQNCRVPTEPIGLQAHAILFGGIRTKARTPWWGDRIINETG